MPFQTTTLAVWPLEVRIIGSNQPLSAGKRYELVCVTSGSRPPATVTWWRNDQRLVDTKESVSTRMMKRRDKLRESMAGYSPASARKSKSETLKSVKYLASPLEIYTCRGKKKIGWGNRTSNLEPGSKNDPSWILFLPRVEEFCFRNWFLWRFWKFISLSTVVLTHNIISMTLQLDFIRIVIRSKTLYYYSSRGCYLNRRKSRENDRW